MPLDDHQQGAGFVAYDTASGKQVDVSNDLAPATPSMPGFTSDGRFAGGIPPVEHEPVSRPQDSGDHSSGHPGILGLHHG